MTSSNQQLLPVKTKTSIKMSKCWKHVQRNGNYLIRNTQFLLVSKTGRAVTPMQVYYGHIALCFKAEEQLNLNKKQTKKQTKENCNILILTAHVACFSSLKYLFPHPLKKGPLRKESQILTLLAEKKNSQIKNKRLSLRHAFLN